MYRHGIVVVAHDPKRLAESLVMLSQHSSAYIAIAGSLPSETMSVVAKAVPFDESVQVEVIESFDTESIEARVARGLYTVLHECADPEARFLVLSDDMRGAST